MIGPIWWNQRSCNNTRVRRVLRRLRRRAQTKGLLVKKVENNSWVILWLFRGPHFGQILRILALLKRHKNLPKVRATKKPQNHPRKSHKHCFPRFFPNKPLVRASTKPSENSSNTCVVAWPLISSDRPDHEKWRLVNLLGPDLRELNGLCVLQFVQGKNPQCAPETSRWRISRRSLDHPSKVEPPLWSMVKIPALSNPAPVNASERFSKLAWKSVSFHPSSRGNKRAAS